MGDILNTSMFERARDFTFTNSTFIGSVHSTTGDHGAEWIRTLQANTVAGAFHNSGERRDPPKCHPGTRNIVIQEIMGWTRHASRSGAHKYLWIYGPAGTGKSSIAQTIAELCEQEGTLASDFFFSRTVAGRNVETKLIPTLACQLTVSIPDLKPYIAAAIASDSLIFTRSLTVQLDTLILKPYSLLMSSRTGSPASSTQKCVQHPNLIIIDGLDECGTSESHQDILSALSSTAVQLSSLIFIISSRPEPVIRQSFNGILNDHTRRIVLDDHYLPDNDIMLFLKAKFEAIKRTHSGARHLPTSWPSNGDILSIVKKASGQFIYASTVMKFIGTSNVVPTKGLNIVLRLSSPGNHTPFAELDALYSTIFGLIDREILQKALTVFAFIFITSELNKKAEMELTEQFLQFDSGELFMVLDGLHSILDIPDSIYGEIRLFHTSVGDYLKDKSRSKEFFIDTAKYRAMFARICAEHLCSSRAAEDDRLYHVWDSASHFSKSIFFQLFKGAGPDDGLLRILADSKLPIARMLESTFRTALEYLPYLLDWIKVQDTELYGTYVGYLDDYLKLRVLASDVRHRPGWKHIVTVLTLYEVVSITLNSIYHLSKVLSGNIDFYKHFISAPSSSFDIRRLEPPAFSLQYILSRLHILLTAGSTSYNEDISSGCAAVDTSSYIQLAIELYERILYLEHVRSSTPIKGLLSKIFIATLDKIPNERELGLYLRHNRQRMYELTILFTLESSLHSTVEQYIKSCNLPEDDMLPTFGGPDMPPSLALLKTKAKAAHHSLGLLSTSPTRTSEDDMFYPEDETAVNNTPTTPSLFLDSPRQALPEDALALSALHPQPASCVRLDSAPISAQSFTETIHEFIKHIFRW